MFYRICNREGHECGYFISNVAASVRVGILLVCGRGGRDCGYFAGYIAGEGARMCILRGM